MNTTYSGATETYSPIPAGFWQVTANLEDLTFHALTKGETWNGYAVVYILADHAAILGDDANAVTPAEYGLVSLAGFCVDLECGEEA